MLKGLHTNNMKAFVKIGDGNYDRHGDVVLDTSFYLSKYYTKKINKILHNHPFLDLKNGVVCPTDFYLFNVFYFEIIIIQSII